MAILETRALSKSYGRTRAVDALDLAVREGEVFGFLGPNGAGKTTSISMIAGVLSPSAGSARIGGHDVHRERRAAARLIGLVPQDLAVYDDLSGEENLRYFGRLFGLRGAPLGDAVRWALGVAGLEERARDLVRRYSGGMKRRLNLAAGLLHRPRLLILDEPTVGVDAQSRRHVFEAVRALNAGEGMTVLYTSHYMEEVQALCTRVAIMDLGKLVALDGLRELIRAHAPPAVELEVDGDLDAAARALEALGSVHRSGRGLRVEGGEVRVAALVQAVEGAGARVRALRNLEADLETVFLSLTGRHLRDGA